MQQLLQSPCYEDVFWKSYASAELLAQLECNKYVLHQPFNRQIKKMKQDGLILAPSTVDDWHQGVCDKIEPLYNLQKNRVIPVCCLVLMALHSRYWTARSIRR